MDKISMHQARHKYGKQLLSIVMITRTAWQLGSTAISGEIKKNQITGSLAPCKGNPLVTGGPSQRDNSAFPFHDGIMRNKRHDFISTHLNGCSTYASLTTAPIFLVSQIWVANPIIIFTALQRLPKQSQAYENIKYILCTKYWIITRWYMAFIISHVSELQLTFMQRYVRDDTLLIICRFYFCHWLRI